MAPKSMRIETPRGVVFHSSDMTAVLKWNPKFSQKYVKKFREAQIWLDSEILRLSEPYVPKLTGMLTALGTLGTEIGSGWIIWLGPYAKFQYYGKVMIGEQSGKVWADKGEKKIVTNRDIQYHGGGLRGSFWVRRMQEVHGRHLERGVKRIIRNS